jgi:hypothetical protein
MFHFVPKVVTYYNGENKTQYNSKKVMLIKINNKNTNCCIMLRTGFSKKLLRKYSQKNENWTIIYVHFSENHR